MGKFGVFAGYAFLVNACIGAGLLAIPHAYQRGGWLLALLLTCASLVLGLVMTFQLIEAISRGTALLEHQRAGNEVKPVSLRAILKVGLGLEKLNSDRLMHMPAPFLADARQYDLTEVVRVLVGRCLSYLYLLGVTLYLAGACTAFANIFGTAMGTHVPLLASCEYHTPDYISRDCRWQYMAFVGVFLVLMVYFTNVEFKEQLWMQVTMTIARVVLMLTIIILALLSLIEQKNINNNKPYKDGDPPVAVFSELGFLLPALLFGGAYQPQLTSILSAIRKDMRVIRTIMTSVMLTLMGFYSALGLSVGFAVNHVSSNVTLNFGKYSNGEAPGERPLWTEVVAYGIVFFPAIDALSIFPIVAHCISDGVMAFAGVMDRVAYKREHRWRYHCFRTVCILPSFAYAFSQVHLGSIVDNAGFLIFFLVPFIIPLLHIASRIRDPSNSEFNCNVPPVPSI